MTVLTQYKEWQALLEHYQHLQSIHLRTLFARDPTRTQDFVLQAAGLSLDYSKNRITQETISLLCQLAHACELPSKITQMFRGENINVTEQRPALHVALRNPNQTPLYVAGKNIIHDIQATLDKMRSFTESLYQGHYLSANGHRIKDIVNIGIGGSDRGPRMAIAALKPYAQPYLRVHFLTNTDGYELAEILQELNPENTLVLVSSKSFTTAETLMNTVSIKNWLNDPLRCKKQLFAITANKAQAIEFGIEENNIFEFWDWVGGRYSLWSAIGLPIMLAIGPHYFDEFLAGAHEMDQHFQQAPFPTNLPIILGLIGIWYINFFQASTHAVLPYSHLLRFLPNYISQLDMESNGKSVDIDGNFISYNTAPIIWGEEECNAQHAFHQLLFQGSHLIPADFILPLIGNKDYPEQQALLIANCLSQSKALAQGQTSDELYEELKQRGISETAIRSLQPHKVIPGNQPSNTILMDQLTPKTLGALIALYEHKIFAQSVIWRINPFDQFGVELGKKMATQLIQVQQA